jgi:transcriptional regulator with XRE-family HTH domain
MESNKIEFGDWLKKWRDELGFTQEELGKAIGKTKQHISNLERKQRHYASGGYAKPSLETVDSLARVLGRPLKEARDVAGYGLAETSDAEPAETVEETLRRSFQFGGEPLSDEEIEKLRPYMEMLDREIDRVRAMSKQSEAPNK